MNYLKNERRRWRGFSHWTPSWPRSPGMAKKYFGMSWISLIMMMPIFTFILIPNKSKYNICLCLKQGPWELGNGVGRTTRGEEERSQDGRTRLQRNVRKLFWKKMCYNNSLLNSYFYSNIQTDDSYVFSPLQAEQRTSTTILAWERGQSSSPTSSENGRGPRGRQQSGWTDRR